MNNYKYTTINVILTLSHTIHTRNTYDGRLRHKNTVDTTKSISVTFI